MNTSSENLSAADPDFDAIAAAVLGFKSIALRKDTSALIEAASHIYQGEEFESMKKQAEDPKLAEMLFGIFHSVFEMVDQASIESSMTCKFYEKTEGKTYDRAAVCHIPTTIDGMASDLKLTLTKLSGTWYIKPPEMSDIKTK